jgi:hypothetical protein
MTCDACDCDEAEQRVAILEAAVEVLIVERDEAREDIKDQTLALKILQRELAESRRERKEKLQIALAERDMWRQSHDGTAVRLMSERDEARVELAEAKRERDAARELVGRLMFRYAPGLEGEPWRGVAEWVADAEARAKADWYLRHPMVESSP